MSRQTKAARDFEKVKAQIKAFNVEPKPRLKYNPTLCPQCFRPKSQCWDTGEGRKRAA